MVALTREEQGALTGQRAQAPQEGDRLNGTTECHIDHRKSFAIAWLITSTYPERRPVQVVSVACQQAGGRP